MAEPVEIRRVVIEYEIRIPSGPARAMMEPARPTVDADMVRALKDELIRDGSRNPDIFGGRA
jgi:hypothetical protein